MYNTDNIFAKIIRKELPCSLVYEDEDILAFHDIKPVAPVHILVIPKKPYISFDDFVLGYHDVSAFFLKIHNIAKINNLTESGYRLVTNIGRNGGQEIDHFHIHIISGKKLSPL